MARLARCLTVAMLALFLAETPTVFACDCPKDNPTDLRGGIIGIGMVLDSFSVPDLGRRTTRIFVVAQADFDRISCRLEASGGPLRVTVAESELSFMVYGKTPSGKLRGYEFGTKRRIYLVGSHKR